MPSRPPIHHDRDTASYSCDLDEIHMPSRSSFDSVEGYYCTLFHELAHSTGHPSRLDRETVTQVAPYGSPVYSREELVAEFGAAFLSQHAGIEIEVEESPAYISSWSKAIGEDRGMVVSAAARAQEAADYILGVSESCQAAPLAAAPANSGGQFQHSLGSGD